MAVTVNYAVVGLPEPAEGAVPDDVIELSTAIVLGTNPAAAGHVRLPNLGTIYARNAANDGNIQTLAVNGANQVHFSGSANVTHLLGTSVSVATGGSPTINVGGAAASIGFYGATAVAKQTGVAVTAEAIHAALVDLGLIGA